MIKRLESAGLGFFVTETETRQKLGNYNIVYSYMMLILFKIIGKIPLRQLVYRVLDLPPSMRPLVYDFGQLKTDSESHYIMQIVQDHVSQFFYALHHAYSHCCITCQLFVCCNYRLTTIQNYPKDHKTLGM